MPIRKTQSSLELEPVRHARFVHRTLRGFGLRDADLDDACQEAMLVAHRRWPSFRGDSTVETWLYGICRRVAYSQRRRVHRRYELVAPDEWQQVLDDDSVEADALGTELDRRLRDRAVRRALDSLADEHRQPLLMYELAQLSAAEIATFLRLSPRTVRERVYKARRALKARVGRAHPRSAQPEWEPPTPLTSLLTSSFSVTETQPRLSYCEAGFCVANVGHLVLSCTRSAPTAEMSRAIGRHIATIADEAPGRVVVIDQVDAAPDWPDADGRREIANMARHFSDDIAAYALVMSDLLPLGRLAVGFINAVILLTHRTVPTSAFATMGDAAGWLDKRGVLGHLRKDHLEIALDAMRRQMDEHALRAHA